MTKVVHVAVGVVKNNLGHILIAKRPLDVHQGGLWEFPGGKVEAGETLTRALARELREELAIEVQSIEPLIQIQHNYSDKSVLLDVCLVDGFTGIAQGNEGQPIRWVDTADLNNYDFPAANSPIITALQLPNVMMITGDESDLAVFEHKLKSSLEHGVKLVQLRQPKLCQSQISIAQQACQATGAQLQLNCAPEEFEKFKAFDGVGLHLASRHLMALAKRPVSLDVLFGVSCHNRQEIQQAQTVGADYLLLSPLLATRSHPDAEPLGWQAFKELVASCKVPVYALGGMRPEHVAQVKVSGAQGVAGISGWWGSLTASSD